MLRDVINAGSYAVGSYFGGVAREGDLQAMSAEQMKVFVDSQGDPRNVMMSEWPFSHIRAMQNAAILHRQPRMTLAEYDAWRASFPRREG